MGAYYAVGNYECEVTAQELAEIGEKKTPALVLRIAPRFSIAWNGEQEVRTAVEPRERTVKIFLTEKTLEFATRDLKRLGYDKPSLRYLSPGAPGSHSFVGLLAGFYCKHEPGRDGEQFERWEVAMPKRERKPLTQANLSPTQMAKLDGLFAKFAKEGDEPIGSVVRTPADEVRSKYPDDFEPRGSGSVDTDDDIPF